MIDSQGIPSAAGWKRTLLLLCTLLIVVCGPLGLGAISAEYTLFRPGPYLEASEQLGLYRTYPGLMLDFAASGGNLFVPGLGDVLMRYLHQRGAEQILVFLFPEEWMHGQVETLVKQFWSYYNFEAPQLDLSLDFTPVKTRLSAEDGMALIRQGVASWPTCSAEDVLRILGLLVQGKTEDLPQCRPPQQVENAFFGALQAGLKSFAQTLPDRVQLLPYQATPQRGAYYNFRLGLRSMPVLVLLLGLLASGLQDFSMRRFWAWIALPLYMIGLVSALGAALLTWLARWIVQAPVGLLPARLSEIYSFFSQVILLVFERFLFWTAVAGMLTAILGLALYLLRPNRSV